jgi:hypothetical protein
MAVLSACGAGCFATDHEVAINALVVAPLTLLTSLLFVWLIERILQLEPLDAQTSAMPLVSSLAAAAALAALGAAFNEGRGRPWLWLEGAAWAFCPSAATLSAAAFAALRRRGLSDPRSAAAAVGTASMAIPGLLLLLIDEPNKDQKDPFLWFWFLPGAMWSAPAVIIIACALIRFHRARTTDLDSESTRRL